MGVRVVQSLQRGLAVLDLLANSRSPLRTSEVAAHFDIDKANASRLLVTLQEAGYAERTGDRRYVLGTKLDTEGSSRQLEGLIDLRERARPMLERLVEATGECAHMAVLVGHRVWYIDKVASPHPLRVDHPVGSLAPLHCTALGKAYLAYGTGVSVGELTRYTARTIVEGGALQTDLDEARQQGFARDDEEFSPGIRCVAAAVRDGGGRMSAAIGLSGPTARLDLNRLHELGRMVRDRALEISIPAQSSHR
jgi:DNA-binding IclR family transcriptional regulator